MSREKAMKRLGGPTVECEQCSCVMLLHLPASGVDICELHWQVAIGFRSAPLGTASSRKITCSKECAEDLAQQVAEAYGRRGGRRGQRMRVTVHGPYTPHTS